MSRARCLHWVSQLAGGCGSVISGFENVMPVTVNLRHLEKGPQRLKGEAAPKELELDEVQDELVQIREPLHYEVEVVKQDENLLVSGRLWIDLDCQCARCLKEFKLPLEMAPYHAFIALEGDEAATVANDLVDLGPFFREDMLLAFPQHPLCSEECAGLANASGSKPNSDEPLPGNDKASPWGELDKLKF